jgi:hypothetical protein
MSPWYLCFPGFKLEIGVEENPGGGDEDDIWIVHDDIYITS